MSDLVGRRLTDAEAVIERGLATFVEVGAALMSIRDDRLYRVEYGTFEDYCRERWGMSNRHANRLVEAAEITLTLGPIGPTSESQARELSGLAPDVAAEVMQAAAESGKVTAASIRDARQTITQPTRPATWTCHCGDHFKSEHTHCATCGDHYPAPVHCPDHTIAVDTTTGEVLDGPMVAGRAAADVVMDVIESDANYRQAILRRDFVLAMGKWRPPIDMDAEEAALLPLSASELLVMRHNLADLNKWVDNFNNARESGLRLISGGKA